MSIIDQFDERFQRHFAAYLMRDTQLLSMCRPYLDPQHFANEVIRTLVDVLLSFYDQHKSAPDQLIVSYLGDLIKQKVLTEQMGNLLQGLCTEMLQDVLQNRDYLLNKYDEVLQQLAFARVLPDVVQLAKQGKVLDAQEHLRTATAKTPRGQKSIGQWFTSDPTERVVRRQERESEIIYTLIPELDRRHLYIRRGELGILQGQRTGIGKSVFLAQMARNAAHQSKRALIITLELAENLYLDRLDSCTSGLRFDELSDAKVVRERIQRLIRGDNMVLVKKFPAYYTTVDTLIQYVKQLHEFQAWHPDVILLDYADLLGVPAHLKGANIYEKGLEIFTQLHGWIDMLNVGMWTVSQSGRDAGKEVSTKMEHTGGSRAKNEIADLVLTASRTSDELMKGITRIGAEKVRNGPTGFEFSIPTDLSRMQFYDGARQFKEQQNASV
jgi:replicative DNA helicase